MWISVNLSLKNVGNGADLQVILQHEKSDGNRSWEKQFLFVKLSRPAGS